MPRPVKVLLVEDDDVDAKAVERSFRAAKVANKLVRVRDGIEGLAVLRGATSQASLPPPRIVLLDIQLPRMDGHEFLAELRADPTIASTVVFVLTTSEAEEDRAEAYRHNVAGYIVKSRAGEGFLDLTSMIGAYWRLVELPE